LFPTTLACGVVGGDFVVIFLLLILVGPVIIGLLFVCGIFAAATTTNLARRASDSFLSHLASGPLWGKPLTLFTVAVGVPALLFAICSYVLAVHLKSSTFVDHLLLTLNVVLVSAVLGSLVYVWRNEPVNASEPAVDTPPVRQIWFQDLIIAMICYAIGLTILWNIPVLHANESRRFFILIFYVFGVGTGGLFMALELCRRSALGASALPRAAVFTAIFTIMPMLWPVACFAYSSWRNALASKTLAGK
jgi:hypothetical protein